MEKNKKILNFIIILISAIILVLLFYLVFFQKNEEKISFIINDETIKLKIGETHKINYVLSDNSIIKWSSNSDVVTINENGEIVANNYGVATITGVIDHDGVTITDNCVVSTYSGDINVNINSIDVPEGYLLMKVNSEYELPFTINPTNSYITNIEYFVPEDNIIRIENNKIVSLNTGITKLSIIINNHITKTITVKVVKETDNKFVKDIDNIIVSDSEITMEIGDTKKVNYNIVPSDGLIESLNWTVDDDKIVSVTDGVIKALNIGNTTVKVNVNNKIERSVNVIVKASKAEIIVNYYPKTTIRIGEKTSISASINPNNLNDSIEYSSSDNSIVKIDNGIITGIKEGKVTITLKISNGKTKSYQITVLPQKGDITGNGYLWGYTSLNSKTPILANEAFFTNLSKNGIGMINSNSYMIKKDDINFNYDISSSTLKANNKTFKLRIYYPPNTDLSTLNTLTYMGGDGEKNFEGYFDNINNNTSMIKSAGIVILVAEGNNTNFDEYCGMYATKFVQAITNQKNTVKNSILGFSTGGTKVMAAANMFNYDKVIVFSSYYNWPTSADNVKNKEVMFYIPANDHLYNQAKSTLKSMSDYKNVTVVSNNSEMTKLFSDKFLVINPGNLMRTGHLSTNVELSGIISYAND